MGFLYPLISFYEPANHLVQNYLDDSFILSVELVLLIFIVTDVLLEFFHRSFDKNRLLSQHYLWNLKLSTRALISFLLMLDFFIFHFSFPKLTYRFSRYLRPCNFNQSLNLSFNIFWKF